MLKKQIKPPGHLRKEGRDLFRKLTADYEFDVAGHEILTRGCEALDRLTEAREIVNREGSIVLDRFGQARAHVAVLIERDCRAGFLAALKMLNVDLEPLNAGPGRPAAKG